MSKKKQLITLFLCCCLFLVIGIIIGQGINENDLRGTSISMNYLDNTYTINKGAPDLTSLVSMLNLDNTNYLDNELINQFNDIKERNIKIKEAHEFLVQMKQGNTNFKLYGNLTLQEWNSSIKNIDDLKQYIEMLNTDNQIDMIRLQTYINKRNEYLELTADIIKKQSDMMNNIVNHMR